MKKTAVLNSHISSAIATLGHYELLTINDAGMPIPNDDRRIDLAVTKSLPRFIDVLETVLTEMEIQKVYLAEEIKTENPDMLTAIKTRLPETPISFIPHTEMKQELNNCHAFIRTGEMTPYANILLESNVVF